MLDQLSFADFGNEKPRAPTDRLLFLLYPDADTAARAAELAQSRSREHRLRGKPVGVERLHVTLHHLGDYQGLREATLADAVKAAATVAMRSFEVSFDRTMSFRGRQNRPFVLLGHEDDLPELKSFQASLAKAMVKVGLQPDSTSKFRPHMTLLYDDSEIAEQPVEPISWRVEEFVLVHSLLGQTKHVVLGRWPLHGAPREGSAQ